MNFVLTTDTLTASTKIPFYLGEKDHRARAPAGIRGVTAQINSSHVCACVTGCRDWPTGLT